MKRRLIAVLIALAAGAAFAADLPVRRVVLFHSGVGYFERSGSVRGDDSAFLAFRPEQIPDVIKSLVLLDEGGGRFGVVGYETRDPAERKLQSLAVDLADNPDMATLLNRLRGTGVSVVGATRTWSGRLVGVEEIPEAHGDGVVIPTWIVKLHDGSGIHRIPMEQILEVQALDEDIAEDLETALDVLASVRDNRTKEIEIEFLGEGERTVRVGCILEAPVWKTSYRLVVEEDDSLFLQGWAHVENMTDEDWEDVRLSLVSGRPVSFIQNLYDPVYVDRPEVELELYEHIQPREYARALDMEEDESARREVMAGSSRMRKSELTAASAPAVFGQRAETMDLRGGGAAPAARGEESGELFEYAIDMPVSLRRRTAAMLPIANATVQGEPLSVYTAGGGKHPMNGLWMTNSSGLFLMRGPVTVFEDGMYAGEALLPDVPADAEQLLTYSLDLACEVDAEAEAGPEEIVSVRIERGTAFFEMRLERKTLYRIRSDRAEERILLIEHPRLPGWDLKAPREGVDQTADYHRLRIELQAGEKRRVEVVESRVEEQRVALVNWSESQILLFLKQRNVPAAVREALERAAGLKRSLEETRKSIAASERAIQEIAAEQNRIRENMRVVQRNTASFTRWEKKLMSQEDRIEQLRLELDRLRDEEKARQRAIDDYMGALTI
jgi:hypothetical protein